MSVFKEILSIFSNKAEASNDHLEVYPEKVHVNALPERRYLKASRFLVICSVISILFNFAMCFIYMHNAFSAGLGYFLRGIYFLLILTLAVFTILFTIFKKKYCVILFATGLSLLLGALLSLLFYEYYVSLILIFITLIQLIIISVGFFKKEPTASACAI